MSTETSTNGGESGRAGLKENVKWYILSYPLAWLVLVFLVPLGMLVMFSFWVNIPGTGYKAGFTLENYMRFATTSLYLKQLWVTVELALVTAVVSLFLGYPLAYYLARIDRSWLRNVLLITVISSLWITYVIRAYAWQVLLSSRGVVSSIGVMTGLLEHHQSFYPGYWALVVGMVYVFLPFMVLSLYSSLRNLDGELLEASKNLGAGPLRTFRRVTLPLTKNGIASGTALVFILALGAYVMPRLLGSPDQRTIPVLIEQQIMSQGNYPFGSAMSIVLIAVLLVFLWVLIRITNVSAANISGGDAIPEDESASDDADSSSNVLASALRGLKTVFETIGLTRLFGAVASAVGAVVTIVDPTTREAVVSVAFRAYVAAVMVYIAAPLGVIVAASFTPEQFLTFPPGGFSLQWYVTFFTEPGWVNSLVNSIGIASAAALLATSIGGLLAFTLDRFDYRFGALIGTFGVMPILVPPVIVAVAFLVFFLQIGLTGTRTGIIVAHGIFYSPLPFILITQGLGELDRTYEEAAMNLGASPIRTIRTITYPLLRANVVSGALFAFILSLNEYIIAWLLSLFLVKTIPIHIFNQLRYSYPPTIAAASTVFIILTVVVMTVINRLSGGIWE